MALQSAVGQPTACDDGGQCVPVVAAENSRLLAAAVCWPIRPFVDYYHENRRKVVQEKKLKNLQQLYRTRLPKHLAVREWMRPEVDTGTNEIVVLQEVEARTRLRAAPAWLEIHTVDRFLVEEV